MTLILGARCSDGVVLVADSKLTEDVSGLQFSYHNKTKGELQGILTAFTGDRGTFEIFTTRVREYVNATARELKNEAFQKPIRGLIKKQFGPTIEQASLAISDIQHDLYSKYRSYDFEVLMGISGKYYPPSKMSRLFYFYPDGRVLPIKDFRIVGSGAPFILYYLKRYWRGDRMEMKEFAQLSDFVIRYVENEKYNLDNAVGLNPRWPYPQITYLPDSPDYCKLHNEGRPKLDCSPKEHELRDFKTYSDKKLDILYSQPFFDSC